METPYSVTGVARELGVTRRRVHQLITARKLQAYCLRGSEVMYILAADLEDFKRRRAEYQAGERKALVLR